MSKRRAHGFIYNRQPDADVYFEGPKKTVEARKQLEHLRKLVDGFSVSPFDVEGKIFPTPSESTLQLTPNYNYEVFFADLRRFNSTHAVHLLAAYNTPENASNELGRLKRFTRETAFYVANTLYEEGQNPQSVIRLATYNIRGGFNNFITDLLDITEGKDGGMFHGAETALKTRFPLFSAAGVVEEIAALNDPHTVQRISKIREDLRDGKIFDLVSPIIYVPRKWKFAA